ncbi:MAG: YceD family protein [Betaproteobacteria bacterium]|nr:YceD family protein [Betaproteobacteria bacterium]
MSNQQSLSPGFVIADPREFARRGMRWEFDFELSGLERLADVLAERTGSARVRVEGVLEEGDCFLVLHIAAEPRLECQRCLGVMPWPLNLESKLLLVAPGEPIPDEDLEEDDFDSIVAERDLNVRELIEEELLLALPLAPRHEKCESPQPRGQDDSASPFAALAKLRGAGNKEN